MKGILSFTRYIRLSEEPTSHVVFLALEAWGHTRPLCTLALRLVQERQIYLTFFTTPNFAKRIDNEISRGLTPETEHLQSLIRVVALNLPDGFPVDPKQFKIYMDLFAEAYEKLVNNQSVTCASTGKEVKTVIAPDAAIMDFFCTPALETVHKISKKPVKVYAWMSGQAGFITYPFGPVHRGGRGDLRPKVMEEVAKTGRPLVEVAQEILMTPTGAVIKTLSGIPPMYDHELAPQLIPFNGIQGHLNLLMHSFIDQCDGIVLSTAQPYEPEAVAEVTAWFAETSREVYTFGHLLPIGAGASAGEQKDSEQSAEIVQFLQKTLETDGPESLLYISFGSIFWSTQPEKIWAFVDAVIERNVPFIFSHASPFAVIPDEIQAKVKAYGKGFLSKWSPQQTILAHPATGWFVTHGGQNSVVEAITLGVPMICWPFDADQPTNSARLSGALNVAYELFEVRTDPHGLKPIHRLGRAPIGTIEAAREEAHSVLDNAFGEDGSRKRANMKKLQQEVTNTWNEDGPARRDLRRFIATLPQ
ncbi:hypothetical protein QCA50_014338 [Cerrena zonata]|uniref:Glycosyltransferase n=1 Tax=Cerrena zonata TaxID=2478898 RepID=A0AAW0FLN0_9APHY